MIHDNSDSISEAVYQYLMDMILSMQMKQGEKIPEEKIAKQFGCSRAPIRDALKRLANEGIVTIYPKRFVEVASYNDSLIKQIGVVRIFLDLAAIKLAILYGSNDEFNKMRELAVKCYEAAKNEDTATRIKNDCAFHLQLSKIAKNQQLYKFANELYIRIEFIQACKYTSMENPEEQYKQHINIVDLLLKRDEKQVMQFLTMHDSNFHGLSNSYPLDFFINA